MNIFDYTIVVDFDGTITTYDSNDMLFFDLGNEETIKHEERFRAGEISSRETYELHFNSLPLSFEKYYTIIDEFIHIDPGFIEFYHNITDMELPFFIVSGGFRQCITRVLKQLKIPETNIYANDLVLDGYLKPVFVHEDVVCTEDIGPCGNCKRKCIEEIKKITGKKILFIGDGLTDRCAVMISDFVFAKDGLVDFCREFGIKFHKFKDFADITKQIFS